MEISSINFTGRTHDIKSKRRNLGSKKYPIDRPAKIPFNRDTYKKKIMPKTQGSKEFLQDIINLSHDSKRAKNALKTFIKLA